jgi:hypothetical protein
MLPPIYELCSWFRNELFQYQLLPAAPCCTLEKRWPLAGARGVGCWRGSRFKNRLSDFHSRASCRSPRPTMQCVYSGYLYDICGHPQSRILLSGSMYACTHLIDRGTGIWGNVWNLSRPRLNRRRASAISCTHNTGTRARFRLPFLGVGEKVDRLLLPTRISTSKRFFLAISARDEGFIVLQCIDET